MLFFNFNRLNEKNQKQMQLNIEREQKSFNDNKVPGVIRKFEFRNRNRVSYTDINTVS